MSTLRYQKRGNKFYVYELTQYWDKELKKPRQKTKYLGVAEVDGGEYKKTGRQSAFSKQEKAILDFGDSFAINEVAKNIGLTKLIQDSFEDTADSIMSLACYQMIEGAAMQNCNDWIEGNIASKLYPNAKIKSQDISRLINSLGKQELQQRFFKNYIATFFPKRTGLLIDSTALPSAINSSINAYGYTSNGIQENVGCLMLVDKESKLPIYFRAIGGDISDNSTLKTTIEEIKLLGLKADSAILDAGYSSKENLQYLCKEGINFVTRLPKSHNVFYNLIDDTSFSQTHANAIQYGERILFIESREVEIYGEKMFVHIILDEAKKTKDMAAIFKNKLNEEQTDKQIDDINYKIKYCGFLVLISKNKIPKQEILPTYYTRQIIEQIFGFSKSNNNLLPLRVHSEQSINGYLMLVFLSLILFITMRNRLQPSITVDQALLRLRSLKAKIYDDTILIQEPSKKVKDVAKALQIIMPNRLGI
jgi:transposase